MSSGQIKPLITVFFLQLNKLEHLHICLMVSHLIPFQKILVFIFTPLHFQVSVTMSRDLDSRVTEREAAAVHEWLKSNKTLHSMRDHPWHTVPIMGGGWGSKLDTHSRRYRIDLTVVFRMWKPIKLLFSRCPKKTLLSKVITFS